MLEDSIKARLKQKDLDPGMLKLQEEFRKLLKRSRGGISKSYTKWDRNIAVYRGNRLCMNLIVMFGISRLKSLILRLPIT